MAAKKKKKGASKGKGKKSGKRSIRLVPVLLVGMGLAFFIQSSFIFLIVGLLPSIVSYYADTSKNGAVFRSVFACNMAGALPYLTELVVKGNSASLLIQYLTDPQVWLLMYLSAGAGYLLTYGMPYFVQFFYEFSNAAKISRLENMQKRLIEEWGPEIQRTA